MQKFRIVFLVCIVFVQSLLAQSIRIEEAWNDSKGQSSVCGHIENEQLTVPSYKFRVTDKNGNIINNLRTEGELDIDENIWTKNGFFDLDPYWKAVHHNIKIPVTYDSKAELYITQEVSKVNIPRRKKIKKCLNKITKLHFSFYQSDCDSTDFTFFFPNKTIDKINLPSSEKIYNLGIIDGYGCVKGR